LISTQVAAAAFMAFLFVVELWAFLGSTVQTGVILDANTDTLLRINFNVTMLDLPCEYAAVDVVDVIGTNKMNVTKNVRNSADIKFRAPHAIDATLFPHRSRSGPRIR